MKWAENAGGFSELPRMRCLGGKWVMPGKRCGQFLPLGSMGQKKTAHFAVCRRDWAGL